MIFQLKINLYDVQALYEVKHTENEPQAEFVAGCETTHSNNLLCLFLAFVNRLVYCLQALCLLLQINLEFIESCHGKDYERVLLY